MSLSDPQFSYFATAPLVGILLGALFFGGLGDKYGRRPVLIAATLVFSLLTLFTGFAQSLTQLIVLRLLAGIGMGGIMPNVVALVGEYSPKRSRAFLMMFISNGFNVGGILVGFASSVLIPDYGWRAVFYFGGVVPILIAALMYWGLPESLQFLALKGGREPAIRRWLSKIAPTLSLTASTRFEVPERPSAGVPVGRLFDDGRAAGTMLLWVINFMNLVVLYFLAQWLPRVFTAIGLSDTSTIWVHTMLYLGGAIGTLILGSMILKHGYARVLKLSFGLGVIAVAAIGQPMAISTLFVVVFVAGFCIVGGQAGLNAMAASFYPTDLRSTGVGYALGIGRVGGIVVNPLAGALFDRGWLARQLLLAAALPAAVTVMGLVGMGRQLRKRAAAAASAPTVRSGGQ